MAGDWTEEQKAVIFAPSGQRFVVDAGPGTGKTAVAIARISHLIDEGTCAANKILVISFTRTATVEIKSRIAAMAFDGLLAEEVRVTTLDSLAAKLKFGFAGPPSAFQDHSASIRSFSEELDSNHDLQQYIRGFDHIIIDEAQDIVGGRADMIAGLIMHLRLDVGVSVFCDEQQGIYSWTDEEFGGENDGIDFLKIIRDGYLGKFEEYELNEIKRTADPKLLEIFTKGRAKLKGTDPVNINVYEDLRAMVVDLAHNDVGSPNQILDDEAKIRPDTLVLFRKRAEALEAASWMHSSSRRIRLSNLPSCLHSWLGMIFWDFTESEISKTEFQSRWSQRNLEGDGAAEWENLVDVAGVSQNVVSTTILRRRASQTDSPPWQLAKQWLGNQGPVFATIFSAKGREAETVRLYLFEPYFGNEPEHERESLLAEARVLYVGATRSKSNFELGVVGRKSYGRAYKGAGGRAFKKQFSARGTNQIKVNVEIGRKGDVTAESMVGINYFAEKADAVKSQSLLSLNIRDHLELHAVRLDASKAYLYELRTGWDPKNAGDIVGYLDKSIAYDFFGIADLVGAATSTPLKLNYLDSHGVRTIAVDPDDSSTLNKLHEPWRSSGFLLAPEIASFPIAYLPRRRSGN